MKQKIISDYGYHKYYKLPENLENINKRTDKSYKNGERRKQNY